MVNIDSEMGRIGEFWWINSNTKPRRFQSDEAPHIAMEGLHLIQWGSAGFGTNVSLSLEAVDD